MQPDVIQWFPGHMAKTRRLIAENLKNVDIIIEILDARIPYSSRNPEIRRLVADKPELILLNKSSLSDPAQNRLWVRKYSGRDTACLLTDCVTGDGISKIAPNVKEILSDKVTRYEDKGMSGRRLHAMVLGIPNVGKSSLINRLGGAKKTKVENRPGVTLDKQWVTTSVGIDLLDMPGILWPKFQDKKVGENLAVTGAIKDNILDTEALAATLCGRLRTFYPDLLAARYKLAGIPSRDEATDFELLEMIGRKRGFLVSGGEINTERTALMLLDEFRSVKIGRITLDYITPEAAENNA